jgi:uncharacterized membrane protein
MISAGAALAAVIADGAVAAAAGWVAAGIGNSAAAIVTGPAPAVSIRTPQNRQYFAFSLLSLPQPAHTSVPLMAYS